MAIKVAGVGRNTPNPPTNPNPQALIPKTYGCWHLNATKTLKQRV